MKLEYVSRLMKVKSKHMLKTMLYVAERDNENDQADRLYVIAVVRGDHDVNEAKLSSLVAAAREASVSLTLAEENSARADGFALGYIGPHAFEGRGDAYLVMDYDAAQEQFWACGANQSDHHVKHFNWKREMPSLDGHTRVLSGDIRNAVEGDPSPLGDGGKLIMSRGIEVGHVFKLGTKYTDALGVTVLDDSQNARPVIMGCYGIGINRIVAAAIEADGGHDDSGIIWPMSIAPYQVLITLLDVNNTKVVEIADRLHQQLEEQGTDTLLDDRDARPGFKFKDADLIGIPIRVTVGEKGLASGGVEIKHRREDKQATRIVDPTNAAAEVKRMMQDGP